jgi:hypothetical protein
MVSNQEQMDARRASFGDRAVDGLFGGLWAGAVMGLYLILVGLFSGDSIGAVLSQFALDPAAAALTGLVSHLAVSALYGILFGLISRLLAQIPLNRWLLGLVYGAVLLLVSLFVLVPGAGQPLRAFPLVHWALAHLIYGWVLSMAVYTVRK